MTLIEVIIVLAISSIFATYAYSILQSSTLIFKSGDSKNNRESSAKISMLNLSSSIKTCRDFFDTTEVTNDSRFNNIYLNDGITAYTGIVDKLAYIEGSDYSRIMYVTKSGSKGKELHKLTFKPLGTAGFQQYKISDPDGRQLMSEDDVAYYNSVLSDKEYIREYADGDVTNIGIGDYSSVQGKYILFSNFGKKYYLWASDNNAGGLDYRYNLEVIPDNDFACQSDEKIAEYIDTINITKEKTMCKISITTADKGKTKSIDTSVYLLFSSSNGLIQ